MARGRKKKKRPKRKARPKQAKPKLPPGSTSWWSEDGLHIVAPGRPPTSEELEEMTRAFQAKLRNSPLWDELVKQYGAEKAEEILQGCRAELR